MKTFPLTQTQLSIYYATISGSDGGYNINFVFHLDDSVSLERLCNALEQLVRVHPHLMDTIVTSEEGVPVFQEPEKVEYHQEITELEALDKIPGGYATDFQIQGGVLFRFLVIRTPKGNHLYMDIHHIMVDGLAMNHLLADLRDAYMGQPLIPETISASQIAEEQVRLRQTERYEEERKWYEATFGAVENDSMPLPDNAGNASISGFNRIGKRLTISNELIQSMCEKYQVTTSIPYTAAFAWLLHIFSGENEVAYSTFYHSRGKEARRTMSMMVRTMPMYHNMDGFQTIADLLHQTSCLIQDVRQKDLVGYAEITQMCGISGAVTFMYQGVITDLELVLEGRRCTYDDYRPHPASLQFLAEVKEQDGVRYLELEYPVAQYSDAMIEQMLDSYDTILSEMAMKENLSDIQCCSSAQLKQLDAFDVTEEDTLSEWKDETVVSLFRKTAAKYPGNIATNCAGVQYTYQQLDELTDAMAMAIRERLDAKDRDAREEHVVSVLIPRGEWMVLAPLAAMKAGCAYQPLDPSYPAERLNFMVKDANAALVITTPELRPLLNEYTGAEILVTSPSQFAGYVPSGLPQLSADRLMILLYTSGSTGVPKGVMLEHRNVLPFVHWCVKKFGYGPLSRTSAYASFGFDANIMDMYPPLLSGGALYVIPEEVRLDMVALGQFIEQNKINHAVMTTQVAQQFAMTYDRVGELKYLVMGGEKMMSMPLPTGYKLINGYGPTECCVAVTYKVVETNENNIPIGQPTETSHLYVVDKFFHRLPVGAPGELFVAGQQVGRGYLNRPEKTREAFIEWNDGGRTMRVYRTGDIVRYRENGDLEFVGRRDGQVKVRGFRIELSEIESVIREFEGITDATVQAYDYEGGGKYVVAYIVSPQTIRIAELEQYIRDRKPPYMVPSYTMQLDSIPLNVNQKVDRRALPKPDMQVSPTELEVVAAPLNILEEQLQQIVAECVHQENIPITVPLIYVGLTSITAMKLAMRVYKEFGVSLDVKSLLRSYTLQDIENDVLRVKLVSSLEETGLEKLPDATAEQMPLTGAQRGIYIDWEANREALQYNVPMAIRLEGAVDEEKLQRALQDAVDAHPALQVRLVQEGGQVLMQRTESKVKLEIYHMEGRLVQQDLQSYVHPFDLMKEPLYRMSLVCDTEGAWLLIDIHHIIYDGLSSAILLKDIAKALEGKVLVGETYSLLSYAMDEQKLVQGEKYHEAEQYFAGLIDGVETTHYPESEGIAPSSKGIGHVRSEVSRKGIEQACLALGITANSYMATVLCQVLHRVTREEKVLFTTISNGRNDMRLMDTVGMFVQTMVVVDGISKGSIGEKMQAMHSQLQDTLQYDFYPFSEIASAHHIAPQVMYAFQEGVMDSSISISGQTTALCTLELETAKVPLSVQIKGTDDTFVIEVEYDCSIYSKEDMKILSTMMANVAMQSTQIQSMQKDILLTTKEEIANILEKSYGGSLEYDHERTLTQWVHHYANTQPKNRAVVDGCSSLTYGELDQRTNLLAGILRRKGVRKDTLVGIMLPRVKEFMVSFLAIHKAGGAYLPLDSEYPNDRLLYMLENSESKVLITTHELFEAKCQEGDFHVPDVIYIEDVDWNGPSEYIDYAQVDGLAYMIYTSGSTGRPKGVMLEHRNLMAFAAWRTRLYFPYMPENQFLCHPSFCFDASICDLIIPLFAGCVIHILPESLRKDLSGMADYIVRNHIDAASMSTQLGMALLNSEDLHMRYLEMGGEKLVQTTPRAVQKVNGYGPTEFACCSSFHMVSDSETEIPIGRPVPNSWSVIVDPEGNLMPQGMPGELCLIGDQMSRGYWHLPEKTEQVFTDCPFMPGKRMYHTGDLAKYNAKMELEYLGRIDHQVKLRGFRIEMGEIEAQLASFPGVTASIAMVQEIGGSKHLVGYYTANANIDTTIMKAHLAQTLTAYMVPDALVQLSTFPLTPNGKIDRKKLPIPQLERGVEYVAPRNELEEQLCGIFGHITGVEQVGVKDNFFDIGGTSLLAIKAVIDITNLGKKVVYGDLFRLKTPEAIAKHLDPTLYKDLVEEDSYYRFGDYDYTQIDKLLSDNHLPETEMNYRPLGNVLLAGATGFMGIHVLDYLIRKTDSTIYCLVRPRGEYSGESRLKTMMVYYLPDTHSALIGKRIHVIEDDITNPELAKSIQSIHIDTILNCAALVKHFAVGTEMDKVNVEGVDHLVRVAEQQGACLVHVSTYSTAGFVSTSYRLSYSEQQLYVGQCTDNEYVRTKFLSERLVLQAAAEGRIRAKVMRVGNLMARAEDGEFQINLHSNAFLNNMKSLTSLGMITSEIMAAPMEMSPIDYVAQAICLLSTTPDQMVLFHPYNNFSMCRSIIVDELNSLGYPLHLATPNDFRKQLQLAMQDESRSDDMQGVIHYTTNIANGLYPLGADNGYTTQVLLWLGFRWPMINNEYIRALLKGLNGLAFFD